MSNQFLKLRRSAVPGKIPTTSSLEFGEIALNTYDGLAFIKKSGSNGEEIVVIGSTSGSFTGSLLGSASYALTSSYSDNIFGEVHYVAVYTGQNTLSTGSIYDSGSFTGIGTNVPNDPNNTERLLVDAGQTDSFNLIIGQAEIDNYLQFNLRNALNGISSSGDFVVTNDAGTEEVNYIDIGINSSNYSISGAIGRANDAYLYSTGEHLHIGNASADMPVMFFAGGLDSEANKKLELWPDNHHYMTGSLDASEGFTGSLHGTASWALNTLTASFVQNAVSASYAATASSADNFVVRGDLTGSNAVFTGTITAQRLNVQYITASTELVTGSTKFGTQLSNTHQFTGSVSVTGSLSVNGGLVPLGSGTAGQVTVWSGSNQLSGSNSLFWDASNSRLGIGTNSPTDTLTVTGSTLLRGATTSSATNALTVQSGDSTQIFYVQNDGIARSLNGFITIDGGSQLNPLPISTNGNFNGLSISRTQSPTSGERNGIRVATSLSPTSGTATSNHIQITGTINQTGGANGITRGLYVNPTLTAAADWRSIEWSNNSGWGLYGAGTANNYLNGALGIGTTANLTNVSLRITRPITGNVNSYSVVSNAEIQNDVTSNAILFNTISNVQNAVFTLGDILHFSAQQGTFGASATVVSQVGFLASSNLTGAGFNVGFRGRIPSAAGRWNLYMDGTALNYLNGSLLIGKTTDDTVGKLQVDGIVTIGTANVTSGRLILYNSGSLASVWDFRSTGTLFANNTAAWEPYNQSDASHNFNIANASIGNFNWSAGTNSNLSLNTQLMRLTRGGNLLIGTTADSGFKLDVSGSARITNGLIVTGSSTINNLTGSLFGTASWALNALTASFVPSTAVVGDFSRIATGSVTASVGIGTASFQLTSGSFNFITVDNKGNVGITNATPFNSGSDFGSGSVDIGVVSLRGGNLFVRGYSSLGSLTTNGYGAVGSNYYMSSAANAVYRRFTDWASAIEFPTGGFKFNSSNGSANTFIQWTPLIQIFNNGNTGIGGGQVNGNITDTGYKLMVSGSGVSGSLNVDNILYVSSSAVGIGLSNPSARLHVSGSTGILFEIDSPTQNNILYVTSSGQVGIGYATTGSLYRLDISGSARVTDQLYIESASVDYQQNLSLQTGSWQTIVASPTGSYRAAFFDYAMFSGSIGRAGTVTTFWSASATEFYENYTEDLGGSTAGVVLQTAISASQIVLQATASSAAWTIRSLVRLL